jgi:hypothetical protein
MTADRSLVDSVGINLPAFCGDGLARRRDSTRFQLAEIRRRRSVLTEYSLQHHVPHRPVVMESIVPNVATIGKPRRATEVPDRGNAGDRTDDAFIVGRLRVSGIFVLPIERREGDDQPNLVFAT